MHVCNPDLSLTLFFSLVTPSAVSCTLLSSSTLLNERPLAEVLRRANNIFDRRLASDGSLCYSGLFCYVVCFIASPFSFSQSLCIWKLSKKVILTMVQLTLHSKAVNLARRFSVQNEPDMMRKWWCSCYSRELCILVRILQCPLTCITCTHHSRCCHSSTRAEESFVEDDSFDAPPKKYTREFCTELSKHLVNEKALPLECYKFRDVVRDLKRRGTDTTHPTSWMA